MSLKSECHAVVHENRKWIHEVAFEGVTMGRIDNRLGQVVVLTYFRDSVVLEGTGVSYFNPGDPMYSKDLGYQIARGQAELSLGARLLDHQSEFFGPVFPFKKLQRIILDAVHRLPGDVRWKQGKKRSKKPQRNTSSEPTVSRARLASVLADKPAASENQPSGNGSTSKPTPSVQYVGVTGKEMSAHETGDTSMSGEWVSLGN